MLEVLNGPPAMTAELDRRLRVLDVVMRHMIVRVDESLAADRARNHRKATMARRRVKRGLPRTETRLHRRRDEDDDMGGGLEERQVRGGHDR